MNVRAPSMQKLKLVEISDTGLFRNPPKAVVPSKHTLYLRISICGGLGADHYNWHHYFNSYQVLPSDFLICAVRTLIQDLIPQLYKTITILEDRIFSPQEIFTHCTVFGKWTKRKLDFECFACFAFSSRYAFKRIISFFYY